MKKIMLLAVVAFFGISANAQTSPVSFGGGVSVLIPASNMKGYSVGAGIDLGLLYKASPELGITGDAGYSAVFPKDKNGGLKNSTIIPVRAGLRFYPSTNFFISGKAGAGFISNKFDNSNFNTNYTAFAYSAGLGYAMDNALDIGLSYDGYSKNGSFGLLNLRLGYWFGR